MTENTKTEEQNAIYDAATLIWNKWSAGGALCMNEDELALAFGRYVLSFVRDASK